MSEQEVLFTGIGGQGVQLAAQVLARAATLEDRNVMLFGVYAGAMRGMNTDAAVVIGDGPLHSPPLVSHAWAAIAMHDKYWEPTRRKLRSDGILLVNDATFTAPLGDAPFTVHRLRATELAAELGNELGGSMVMLGAFVGLTGIVTLDSTIEAMRQSIPPYRTQHIAANERALRAGLGMTAVPA